MIELLRDRVTIRGSADAIWAILEDASALGRVLPGAETIVSPSPGQFIGVVALRIQFLTIRADVEATIEEPDPPRHLRLALRGRPRGIAGSFQAAIVVDLETAGMPGQEMDITTVEFAIQLETSGRLATFGSPLLREVARRQIAEMVRNFDRELAGPTTVQPQPAAGPHAS